MPRFSATSLANLQGVHPDLSRLFLEVVRRFDCTVLEGVRTHAQQAENVRRGVSRTLDSKHLSTAEHPLARAVDVAPFPLRWPNRDSPTYSKDLARYYLFGGYVLATARSMGVAIRWGGDWDGDWDIHEQHFDDLVHFELLETPF